MRISMIAALGSVTLRKSSVSPNNATGLPVGVQEFEITPSSGTQSVRATVLHCPPHERKAGPSRHTTESCIGDLVEVLGVEEGEKVAFIGAQPHIQRMKMTVDRSFRRAGRHDVRVYGIGPALDAGTPVEICASEVYKTLFELQQL